MKSRALAAALCSAATLLPTTALAHEQSQVVASCAGAPVIDSPPAGTVFGPSDERVLKGSWQPRVGDKVRLYQKAENGPETYTAGDVRDHTQVDFTFAWGQPTETNTRWLLTLVASNAGCTSRTSVTYTTGPVSIKPTPTPAPTQAAPATASPTPGSTSSGTSATPSDSASPHPTTTTPAASPSPTSDVTPRTTSQPSPSASASGGTGTTMGTSPTPSVAPTASPGPTGSPSEPAAMPAPTAGTTPSTTPSASAGPSNPPTPSPSTGDSTAPVVTRLRVSGPLYPYKDGYADIVTLAASVDESGRQAFLLRRPSGALARTVHASATGFDVTARFDGKDGSGRLLGAGDYLLSLRAIDAAGNASEQGRVTVQIRNGRLTLKPAVAYIAPSLALRSYTDKYCSYAVPNYRRRGDVALASAVRCSDGQGDVVAAVFKARLPKAIRYGSVKVTATGEGILRDGPVYIRVNRSSFRSTTNRTRNVASTTQPFRVITPDDPGVVEFSMGVSDGAGYVADMFRIDYTRYVIA